MASEASVVWNKPGEERIPRPFGRLWLLRRLARGGMGEVYLAATSGIEGAERPCVVKIIRRDHAADKSFLARFFDEARVQAQLQHHGVAQVVEASTDPTGEPYVVVEYVEGRSLAEVRARASHTGLTIEWADAVALGVSAAEALAHVHERTDGSGKPLGIVHRDLSPQNVMIGYGGDLKLIDFGTARAENRRCHTISGVVFAKPGYVAPEVAAGNSGDARVDLYALGIILWELLAGRRFLEGDPTEHLALVAKNERRPPPIAKQVGAPPRLDDVIAKLTAHALQDRYESARQVASDLVKLLATCAPLPNGERGVRARAAFMMQRLYPAEPAKSRAEFDSLVKAARWAGIEESSKVAIKAAEASPGSPAAGVAPMLPTPPRSPLQSITDGDPNVLVGTRYRILGTIGSGAMGTVYEAQHVDLLRRAALKVLSQDRAMTTDLAAFRREAQAIASVTHPNLVMIHDFGESADGRPYCAMELLEGETLEQRLIQDVRLDWREAVKVGILACRGLEAAHAVGVIHCDLKPANLFVTKGATGEIGLFGRHPGELKILDFGIARIAAEGHHPWETEGKFAIAGTPEYMAPEQGRAGPIDARADVYALGCVLYELCTGRRPFVATSAVELLEMKGKFAPEPMRVRSRSLGLPAALDRVVMRALASNPDERHASAEELRHALEELLRAPRRRRMAARFVGYAGIAGAGLFALSALGVLEWTPGHAAHRPRELAVMGVAERAVGAAVELGGHALGLVAGAALPELATAAPREINADEPSDENEIVPVRDTDAVDESGAGAAPGRASQGAAVSAAPTALPEGRPAAMPITSVAAPVIPAPNAGRPVALAAPAPLASASAGAGVKGTMVATAVLGPNNVLGATGVLGAPGLTLPPLARPEGARPAAAALSPAGSAADPVGAGLRAGAAALEDGFSSQALIIYRDLAARHPRETRAVRAWAESAAAAQEWSEAAQAAESWSLLDASVEPRLFLARMLAYGGKTAAARRMLEDLLEAHPECDEARALMAEYRGAGGPTKAASARAEPAQPAEMNREAPSRP